MRSRHSEPIVSLSLEHRVGKAHVRDISKFWGTEAIRGLQGRILLHNPGHCSSFTSQGQQSIRPILSLLPRL